MKYTANNIVEKLQKSITGIIRKYGFIMECLISLYAVLGNTNAILDKGYDVNIPVIKYVFVLLRYFDGWGIEKIILSIGIIYIFYTARKCTTIRKNPWLKGFCGFFAICMVLGKSYSLYNSWDYIFKWWMQFVIAVFVIAGYYILFLNFSVFCISVFQKKKNYLFRIKTQNKIENFLFEEYPFRGTFFAALLFLVPYIIAFFPGTLHWDALEQLWRYYGIIEMNNHHPAISSLLMGKCIDLGKYLFHSDSIGLFIYIAGNCVFQCISIAYMMCFLKKIKTPILIRWMTLVYFLIFPVFPMWAITFVKDTPYYISVMLLVVSLANIVYDNNKGLPTPNWQKLLMFISTFIMVLFRNNGMYIIVITSIILLFLYRQNWKLWIFLSITAFCLYFYMGNIYLQHQKIEAGEIGEALSIPLQQTARYIVEHGDEITADERDVLEELFQSDLSVVAEEYNPEISDPVKALFAAHPSSEQLKAYFNVWAKQFIKHPATYIQAYFNQYYAYFYPDKREVSREYMLIFRLNGWEKWEDEYITIEHAIESMTPRKFFENYCYSIYAMPVAGMLFSTGLNVYLLLGCAICLMANKKLRSMAVLVPSLCALLVCLASPIATIRYMLPIMAVFPLNAAWCVYAIRGEESK